jgi:hypothetical protein
MTALPEEYRPVSSVEEGDEVRMADGTWETVTGVDPDEYLTIFDLSGGKPSLQETSDQIMCRRPATPEED